MVFLHSIRAVTKTYVLITHYEFHFNTFTHLRNVFLLFSLLLCLLFFMACVHACRG